MWSAGVAAFLVAPMQEAMAKKADLPSFSMPLNCTIEKDCWIQNLVDFDAGSGWSDPYCGTASFNNHKGTDFRVRYLSDLKSNVPILAMADGKVVALRNSMADQLIKMGGSAAHIKNKECGNGVFIEHGKGWSTQLCHLAKGSVQVKKGQNVKRGDVVGFMGASGFTTFPHVHVTVRKGKTVIDPLTGLKQTDACSPKKGLGANTLWDEAAQKQIKGASSSLLSAGFSNDRVSSDQLMKREAPKPKAEGPLILYANFINLEKGDRIDLTINGPKGVYLFSKGDPLPAPKAVWTVYSGKKGALAPGSKYRGSVTLYRKGKAVITRDNLKISF